MSVKTSENSSDLSKYLIIHAHGGGWITQTAKLRKLLSFQGKSFGGLSTRY